MFAAYRMINQFPPSLRSWPCAVQKTIALRSHSTKIMDTDHPKKNPIIACVGISRDTRQKQHPSDSICFNQLAPQNSWMFHRPDVPFCRAAVAAVPGRSLLPQDARRCGRTGSLTLDDGWSEELEGWVPRKSTRPPIAGPWGPGTLGPWDPSLGIWKGLKIYVCTYRDSVSRPSADNHAVPSRDFQIEHNFPTLNQCATNWSMWEACACSMTKQCTDWKTLDLLFVAIPFPSFEMQRKIKFCEKGT